MEMKGDFALPPVSPRLQHTYCEATIRLSVALLWDCFVSRDLIG